MLESVTILHVSDFHFSGDEGGLFTTPRMEASVSALVSQASLRSRISAIVATGDFIRATQDPDHRRVAWGRALTLMSKLQGALNIPPQNIILCPGNHDALRNELFPDDGSDRGDGLTEYNLQLKSHLLDGVTRKNVAQVSEFATAFQLDLTNGAKVYALELNMMHSARQVSVKWGAGVDDSKTVTAPGVITEHECSQFKTNLERIWDEGLLIVACHFPITNFDWSQAFEEASEHPSQISLWAMNHIASGWGNILNVLIGMTDGKKRQLLMLHGDTHRQLPVFRIGQGAFASTSGRLDEPLRPTLIAPHCRRYRLNAESFGASQYDDIVFNYDKHDVVSSSHISNSDQPVSPSGNWLVSPQEFPLGSEPSRLNHAMASVGESIPMSLSAETTESNVTRNIADEIRERIRDWNLFELRRVCATDVNGDKNSIERLGHIRLGPILNDPEYLSEVLKLFARWIAKRAVGFRGGSDSNCLIVGVDAWGAAMGASLGLRLNMPSIGVTVRGVDQQERKHIIRLRPAGDRISEFQRFIVVTDVVVTGQTLRDVKALIEDLLEGSCEIAAVCVIAARTTSLFGGIGVGFPVGAIITDIEIPIVPVTWLPDVSLLPAESFGFGPFHLR